jgi:hypothetical protein
MLQGRPALAWLMAGAWAHAQAPTLDAALNETVEQIPKKGVFTKFLAEIGMPHAPQSLFERFGAAMAMPAPARTDFAPADDESLLPHVKDTGRAAYRTYREKQMPRAYAIAPSGAWGWAHGGDDPLKRALDNCNRNAASKGECRLYSVDDYVVWKAE